MKQAISLMLALSIVACGKKDKDAKTVDKSGPVPSQGTGSPPPPAASGTPYATPESIALDEAHDRYIVTNINGGPADHDDNGFILTRSADAKTQRWIDGASPDIKLDAPKGFALIGD